jgi:hypothetical protein
MVERFAACPDHLHVQCPAGPTDVVVQLLEAEADEMWSFVWYATLQTILEEKVSWQATLYEGEPS